MNYSEFYKMFGNNSKHMKLVGINEKFSLFRSTPEFRKELLKAIHACLKNGWWDLLQVDGGTHIKTAEFIDALYDENNALYKELRDAGFEDEMDILLTLDSRDFLSIKSEERNPKILQALEDDIDLYYEYRIVREGIDLYIKIVFLRNSMAVDIHSEVENF